MTALDAITARKPKRADALRNYDALVAAARAAFAEQGSGASLEDIARRAGVGIGTLYRNFPTRADLAEAVYVEEVLQLAQAAERITGEDPWTALVHWLDRFVEYIGTKNVLLDGLNRESETFQACRATMYGAGEPVLRRAQDVGLARSDVTISDVVRYMAAVAGAGAEDAAQRERLISMAIESFRAR
ncbi:helix-turn-helix domain-containing protein [Galbitalea sp. SE-J8]|uniref:TetR/AcrR family transcriptional regulator n=1 Tax=Galbitalea sp. SE-J8 TaxID=3054952 RepID=UPI00259C762D|nr:TetR/AcrR family transcriptional regulator [Galbitalea sp. SE-J8]MDM4762805.1 helix-turn-helix domain-containing protein [Galbitalea sp. SE-J8]